LRRHIGEIIDASGFYANAYCNNKALYSDKRDEAERELRARTTDVNGRASEVIWHISSARVKLVPKKMKIEKASAQPMALANSVHDRDPTENGDVRKKVDELLGYRNG
jgi:hypothetical protein